MEENNQRINKALDEIQEAIDSIRDLLNTEKKISVASIKKMDVERATKILKRAQGIIKNHNDSNSEIKLRRLVEFLKSIEKKFKE